MDTRQVARQELSDNAMRAEIASLAARIAELERELAEARKDSERLDWYAEHLAEYQRVTRHKRQISKEE